VIQTVLEIVCVLIILLYTVILIMSRGKGEPKGPRAPVRVIVPTHNEAGTVGDCLDSLLRMESRTPHSIHVIDDDSTDGTPGVVSRYGDRVELITRPSRRSKADALNDALNRMSGEHFAIVDGDCTVEADWISRIVAGFADPSVGICTGSVLVRNRLETIWSRAQSCEMAFLCHQMLRPVERVGMLYSINGNNFALTRECWERVGGFDTSKLTEDTDFAIRTRMSGLQIRFAPAKVYTRVPERIGALLRQRRRWYIGWYQDLSTASLFAGAIFILLFYYASLFFLAAFSLVSVACLATYLVQLTLTYRSAYGETSILNPLLFIVLGPIITTATIITALPKVIKGTEQLDVTRDW